MNSLMAKTFIASPFAPRYRPYAQHPGELCERECQLVKK